MSIIIDFYGVPGAGKSTISHELVKVLKSNGATVISPSYELDHQKNKINRKLIKFILSTKWILKNYNEFQDIKTIFKHSKREYLSDIVNICYKKYYVDKYSSCDYIIFDEGFAQSAVSACFFNEINVQKAYDIITKKIKMPIVNILMIINDKNAIERIAKRGTFDSRLDKERNKNNQLIMIKKFSEICNSLRVKKVLKIRGDNKTVTNINIIKEYCEYNFREN